MPNLRIVPYNLWDDMSMESTFPDTDHPIENTQTVKRSKVFRSAEVDTTDDVYVIATAPAASGGGFIDVRANCLFFFRHNLYGCGLQVDLYDGTTIGAIGEDPPGNLVWSSGGLTIDAIGSTASTYDWGHVASSNALRYDPLRNYAPYVVWFDDTESFKQITLTISPAVNNFTPEIGRIFLGNYKEMYVNPRFGASLGTKGNGDQGRTRGGSLLSNAGERWKTINYELGTILEEQYEREFWLDMMEMNGMDRDWVMAMFPEDTTRLGRDYTGNYKFTSLDAIDLQVSYRTKRVVAEEC